MSPRPVSKVPMKHKDRVKITIRREADNKLSVVFPESIKQDLDLVIRPNGDIPTEFLMSALARTIVSRTQLAAGCENNCHKDCLW